MDNNDLHYIFSNITLSKMNIYPLIPTSNTMKQYISVAKSLGFNYASSVGRGNQKTLILKRKDETVIDEIKDRIYPINTSNGVDIASDKFLSEEHLSKASVRTTQSKLYDFHEVEKAKEEFYNNNKYSVIKPANMSQGKGVNVKVKKEDFDYYWEDTVNSIGNRKMKVIVQEYIEGFEARAVILLGKLISIVARVPAYVKGNGKNSIAELIKIKNTRRQKCSNLKKRKIIPDEKMDLFLRSNGVNMDTVPKLNQYILLSSLSNISHGGEMVDITDYVGEEIKQLALESIAAIPGLYSGGADIMIKNFQDQNPVIIEINAWPMLQSTIYPTYGKAHKPQEYFLNAYYSIEQFINETENNYDIVDSFKYIISFIKFQKLKIKMYENQLLSK